MSDFHAPVKDMLFTLTDMVGWQDVNQTEAHADLSEDLMHAVLTEAGKFMDGQVAPFSRQADLKGVGFDNGKVSYPQEWIDAWQGLGEGGWLGLAMPAEYDGQGMPQVAYCAVHEMMCASCLSFAQGPGLTVGAVEAIEAHATDELKAMYIPKMATGQWAGTMNLTEPNAGSDVGALRSKAIPQADGSYKIIGNKIFITCGDHDYAENIVHLVLARVEGAPEGSKGISLFIVPKFIPNADGSLGEANDLRCTGLEEKLGLHSSSNCAMSYGDNGGATGWLVGEENKGLACMFTMMNLVRLHVGLQGPGIAERAYQKALAYAADRVQGVPIGAQTREAQAIINHADVRRMLMDVKVKTAAARAICFMNAKAIDLSLALEKGSEQQQYWSAMADLLTPMSKAYGTDVGVESTNDAVQVFGGMGFIEETGIAQLYRDARIMPIYEGTNGIQSWDLANRKLKMNGGALWRAVLGDIQQFGTELSGDLAASGEYLAAAATTCAAVGEWFIQRHAENPRDVAAGSVAFNRMMSETVGGWLLLRGAVSAQAKIDAGDSDAEYLQSRIVLAQYFAQSVLSAVPANAAKAQAGDALLFATSDAALASQ